MSKRLHGGRGALRPTSGSLFLAAMCLAVVIPLASGLLSAPAQGPTVGLRSSGSHPNAQLAYSSIPNISPYWTGELWGNESPNQHCSFCSPSGVVAHTGGQSVQPGQDVNPVDGSYITSQNLFSVPAVGGNLALDLTYDSGQATSDRNIGVDAGYFGYGWNSTMSSAVAVVGVTVFATSTDGGQDIFNPASNDGCPVGDYPDFQKYTVPESNKAYCAANRTDAQLGFFSTYAFYQLNEAGGAVTNIYNMYGQLAAQGNLADTDDINYTYNETPDTGNCPASAQSSCFTEADTNDRLVVAEVDDFGLVSQVIDPDGRTYTMGYTDGMGDLNSITAPAPASSGTVTTSFGYQLGSSPYTSQMTSLTNPDNKTTSIQYYSYGMVEQVTDPLNAGPTSYSYSATGCPTQPSPPNNACTDNVQITNVTYADGELDQDVFESSQLAEDSFGATTTGGNDTEGWTFNYTEPTSADPEAPIVESIQGTNSLTASISTDSDGNVVSYTDPNLHVTSSMYNDTGGNDLNELCWTAGPTVYIPPNVSCSSPPTGATTYTYDVDGDELSSTDPLGNTTRYGYYNNQLPCWSAPPTVTGPGGPCPNQGVTPSGAPTGATTYTYDQFADVVATTLASGTSAAGTTTSSYDLDGEVMSTNPPDGQGTTSYQTSYSRYANGAVASETAPLSRVTSYTYDNAGNVLTSTDPAGITTNTYDGDGRLCSTYRTSSPVTNPACGGPITGATTYTYLKNTDAPVTVTDPDGSNDVTTYQYGEMEEPTSPTMVQQEVTAGSSPTYQDTYDRYDTFGNLCVTGPVNPFPVGAACQSSTGDTYNYYNAEGQLIQSVGANSSNETTNYAYSNIDFPTQPTTMTNTLSKVTSYQYDADGNQIQTKDPEGNYVSTSYDADGRPCSRTPSSTPLACGVSPNAAGVTALTYDAAGRRYQMADYGEPTNTYSYDASGNLLNASNDNGQTTTYGYDYANDPTCVSYPIAGKTQNCSQPQSSSNAVVIEAYNPAGEISSTTDWLGNTVKFNGYNALGEVGQIAYPASTGESLNYGYDADGNLTSAMYAGNVTGLAGSETWTPNQANLVGSSNSTGLGGYSSSDSYDTYGRVSEATNPGSVPTSDLYGYNNDSSIASDTPNGQSAIQYSYSNTPSDELTQITNSNLPAASQDSSYSYTNDGQRCYSSVYSSPRTVTCGMTAPSGSTAFVSYGWNSYGELCWSGATTTTSAGTSTCPSSAPSGTTAYTYDGNGLRMTASSASGTKTFDWDLVNASSIPLTLSDGTNSYIYGPLLFGGTAPVEQINSSGTASFIAAVQSGVQAVFTGTTLNEEAEYTTYGTQVLQVGSQPAATPFGFQGSYSDPIQGPGISGLDYLVNRYYDPSSAQFLSVDPDVAQTGQPYAYTEDDPLNATDPLGKLLLGAAGQSGDVGPNGVAYCTAGCGTGYVSPPPPTSASIAQFQAAMAGVSEPPPLKSGVGAAAAAIYAADSISDGQPIAVGYDLTAFDYETSVWFTRLLNFVDAASSLGNAVKINDDLITTACGQTAITQSAQQGLSTTQGLAMGVDCYGTLNTLADSAGGRQLVAKASVSFSCVDVISGDGFGPAQPSLDKGDQECNSSDADMHGYP